MGTGVGGIEADHVLDLLLDAVGLGSGQVDLVEDGHDFVAGIERVIDVGKRLRSTPCEASTTRSEPSQAANERETS